MSFLTTHAVHTGADPVTNAKQAVRQIRADFGDFSGTVIVYASIAYDPETVAAEIHNAFPKAVTFGCTSSGECVGDLMLQHSVAAVALSDDFLEFSAVGLVTHAVPPGVTDAFASADECLREFSLRTGATPLGLDYRQFVGFSLFDAVTPYTEEVIIKLAEMTDVNFIGGMAGDDYRFEKPCIFYRGKTYRNAGVVALWKPINGFALLKTQAAELTEKSFLINKADEEKGIIWELDHKPAAQVYADAVGLPVEALTLALFDEYPIALAIDGEPFLKVARQVLDNGGLTVLPSVRTNTRVTLCKTNNIIQTTAAALKALRNECPSLSGMIHVNCVSRHMSLAAHNQVDEFGKLFHGIPNAGFSSYGEIYIGIVGLTSTMIAFK